ncbi:MAG: NAD+ synthase [Candidatus Micrarchaeota archaeon]
MTFNAENVSKLIRKRIREYVKESGCKGVVIGVSGGVDSAVCASLAVKALGKRNVFGIIMPKGEKLASGDVRDAIGLCKKLGIGHRVLDIGGAVDEIGRLCGTGVWKDRIIMGNAAARVRMTVLYSFAYDRKYLVLGTGNKSELLLGYFTKYGDGGVDLLPLGDIYKGDVLKLAKAVGVPKRITGKAPSPNLWEGQSDEGELGFSYALADRILSMFLESGMDGNEITRRTGDKNTVRSIYDMVRRSSHKRTPPRILSMKLGLWQ